MLVIVLCDNKSSYDLFVSDSPVECYEHGHTSNNIVVNVPNVFTYFTQSINTCQYCSIVYILMKMSACTFK